MTSAHPTLTDSVLERALAELAGNPDSQYLVEDVLRTASVTRQQRRFAWPFEFSSRMVIIAMVALLLVGLIASLGAYSQLRRLPMPVPRRHSSLVIQQWNGLRGTDSAISQTTFGGTGTTGVDTAGVPLAANIPANAVGIRWSPDGKHLVYVTREAPLDQHAFDETGYFVADANGENSVPVELQHPQNDFVSNGWWAGAIWAPTGDKFALVWDTGSCSGGDDCMPPTGIEIFDANGVHLTGFDTPGSVAPNPVWSPDGTSIGWLTGSCIDGMCSSDAFHWRPVTDDQVVTTLPVGPSGAVTWLGNNRLGVVITDAGWTSAQRVFSMAPDGSDERDVNWPASLPTVSWSPDGRWLVAVDSSNSSLTIRDVESGEDKIVTIPTNASLAGWSPESDRMILVGESADPQSYSLYVVNVDGTGFESLGDGDDFGWMPAVTP
jgi:Tol biopolymer transport system component